MHRVVLIDGRGGFVLQLSNSSLVVQSIFAAQRSVVNYIALRLNLCHFRFVVLLGWF